MARNANPKKVFYIENNAFDRAVMDLHLDSKDFELRYSEQGSVIKADEKFLKRIEDEKISHVDSLLLLDLGLGPESERLMPTPAVNKKLSAGLYQRFLLAYQDSGGSNDLFQALKGFDQELADYIEKIEGLRLILEIKEKNHLLLCGIISHYVNEEIRSALEVFVLHPMSILQYEIVKDFPKVLLVFHKGELTDLNEKLKTAWREWQKLTSEIPSVVVVQKCIVHLRSGVYVSLRELIDFLEVKKSHKRHPIIFFDSMGLSRFMKAQLTLKRLFLSKIIGIDIAENTSQIRGKNVIFIPSSQIQPEEIKGYIQDICQKYNSGDMEQLICFLPMKINDIPDELKTPPPPLNKNFMYFIPNVTQLMELNNEALLNDKVTPFLGALISSAHWWKKPEGSRLTAEKLISCCQNAKCYEILSDLECVWENILDIEGGNLGESSKIEDFLRRKDQDMKSKNKRAKRKERW